jgi:hypothetical protein
LPVTCREERLQSEIEACAVARHGLTTQIDLFLRNEVEPEMAAPVPEGTPLPLALDRHCLDGVGDGAALAVLVDPALDLSQPRVRGVQQAEVSRVGTALLHKTPVSVISILWPLDAESHHLAHASVAQFGSARRHSGGLDGVG